jgi:hypothetical protein
MLAHGDGLVARRREPLACPAAVLNSQGCTREISQTAVGHPHSPFRHPREMAAAVTAFRLPGVIPQGPRFVRLRHCRATVSRLAVSSSSAITSAAARVG